MGKMDKRIELQNVVKKYNNEEILKGINYTFYGGKFYAIMGKSGVGKTTLLNIISTLDSASNGDVLFKEQALSTMTTHQKAELRNKEIGFIFQSFNLLPQLNAVENVMLPMYLNKEIKFEVVKDKAEALLTQFDLCNRLTHFPYELSAGQQQRVAIARALINEPSIIIADEPSGNLDEENETFVFETLKKLSEKGKTIIVVSHNREIMTYSDVNLSIKSGLIGDFNG